MEEGLWVEKYRPKDVISCILPKELKSMFTDFVSNNDIPNLILSGQPGVGKTTIAKAMLDEMGATYMMINGSDESGIDVLRTKIKNFASTVSLEGGRKFLILDEADYLNPQSTQPALRGVIEEFHKNCGFILTCNYKNRIIPALHSRCKPIEFIIPNKQKPQLAKEFYERLVGILEQENIKFEQKALAEVINKHFPDWRRIIQEVQAYSHSGSVDAGILVDLERKNIKELLPLLKRKELSNVRRWIVDNMDNDPDRLFRNIYDIMFDSCELNSIPNLVVLLGEYQYKSAIVADQEINMFAFLTEIMVQVKFK